MSINNTCPTGEVWEPHAGLDYACVMLPGETTDTASISVHTDCPDERDRLLMQIAAIPQMLNALSIARRGAHDIGPAGSRQTVFAALDAAIAAAGGAIDADGLRVIFDSPPCQSFTPSARR